MALPLDADALRKLRLLLTDDDPANQTFSDQKLSDFWELEDGILKCAAALALERLAKDDALALKYVETTGLKTNGKTAAEGILLTADRWRQQVKDAAALAARASAIAFTEICL